MLGSINCFIKTGLRVGKTSTHYDGTTLDLVKVAVRNGAKADDVVRTEDGTRYRIVSAPHDERAGGYWAERLFRRSK
jgi:hypothetical protein